MTPRAYLDHNATSPLRPEARAAMLAVIDSQANASSVHREGQNARGAVENARAGIASLLGCRPEAVVFTAGGTEACQLAAFGAIRAAGIRGLLVSAIEHSAVLDAAAASGVPTQTVPVLADGTVDLDALERQVGGTGEGCLVAVMAANNETGIVQPVADVARIAHRHGALVLSDAIQAFGKRPLDVAELDVDFAALSAHKLGGPQGAGALYVRDPAALAPVIAGRQERGLRGGTENVAAIAGFAAAARAAHASLDDFERLSALRERLEAAVLNVTPEAVVVGPDVARLANTSAIALPGARAETLVIELDLAGVAVSAGAACSSGKVASSHVLGAMGLGPEIESSAIRVSTGWSTTGADIDTFIDAWSAIAARRRATAA